MANRFYVQTFGCQMNVHDSERLEDVLRAHGWNAAVDLNAADLIIFNTCSVREKAEQKLRSEVGKLAPLRRRRPDLIIAVAGCVAQQEGEALLRQIPLVDIVIGPDNIAELPALALAHQAGAPPVARTVFDMEAPRFLSANPQPGRAPVTAYVTTMKGCDERCSFCVVPYTRGPERYRPVREIIDEAARWVSAGAREILLLGQTVDSYRDHSLPPPASDDPDESQFPALLRLLSKEVPQLLRLRYVSPHPRHATASLVAAHAELPVLARHVHMPVQSGSNRMLRRMIRRYTREEYIQRMRRLQAAVPGMTLSSDIIVGFPGETEEDFAETLSLCHEMGFLSVFGYKYSPRPHTPALKLPGEVPDEVMSERLGRLFALVDAQGSAYLHTLLGSRQQVLVEGPSKRDQRRSPELPPLYQGRTAQNEIVHLELPASLDPTGVLVNVDILRANRHSLVGALTPASLAALPPAQPQRPRPLRNLPVVA